MPGPVSGQAVLPLLRKEEKIMQQFKAWFARVMHGRYGPDQLYRGLLVVVFAFVVINLFVPGGLFYYLSMGVFAVSIFRVFSRNHAKRAEENRRYLAWLDGAKKKLLQVRNRFRDRDTHRYRPCPSCKTTLRLKKQVGTMHVRCPKCGTEFDVNIRR